MTAFSHHWNAKRDQNQTLAEGGSVTVTRMRGRYHLVAPFHPEMPNRLRDIGGRWRFRSQVWSIPTASRAALIDLLTQYYGHTAVPKELQR